MGDALSFVDPLAGMVLGGDDKPKPIDEAARRAELESIGQATPNLFKPSQRYMPAEYHSNQPIYDPTAILGAYQNNMPEFARAARSQSTMPPIPPNTAPPRSGK